MFLFCIQKNMCKDISLQKVAWSTIPMSNKSPAMKLDP